MSYNLWPMNVKVGFSRGTSVVARAICAVTQADISHSFFLVEDGDGKWVYEAVPGPRGFRRMSWEVYKRHNAVKGLVDMQWPHEEVKKALDAMLGTQYHVFRFFWIGLMLLLKRPVEQDVTRFDCVTSVLRVMGRFGHSLLEHPLTPAELRKKLGA